MNQSEFDNLLQTATERDLTDGELARLERWLAANPADQAEWEELDHLLATLPDTPGATTFTARVLDEVRRAETAHPALGQAWWQRLLAPQFRPIQIAAAATLAMVPGGVGYQSHLNQSRAETAARVSLVARLFLSMCAHCS